MKKLHKIIRTAGNQIKPIITKHRSEFSIKTKLYRQIKIKINYSTCVIKAVCDMTGSN